jgi:hypothetical protein
LRFEYTYNDNTDLPTFIYHRHTTTPVAGNNYTYIVGKTLSYGPANRINELIMAVNNPANQTIVAQYDYNPIGQHTEKNLHKPDGAADFLQSVDYRYNNRGWMTSINDQTNLNNETGTIALAPDLYAQILLYTSTGAFGGTNQFNGNISSTYWRNATDFVERGYAFSYDEMNRLKKSYSSTTSTDGNWDEQCAYDPAGNILSLQRRGNTGASSYGLIDRMHYNYIFSGTGIKKLNAIDDQITASFPANDFEDNGSLFSAVTIPEYIYDANGNIVTDYNKGITTRYNHLNLPDKVTFHSTGNTITWLYTATGRKLQKRTCQVEIGAMPPPPTTPPIDKHRFYSARLDSVGSARLPGTDTLTEGEYYHNISDRIQFIKRMLPPTFTPPRKHATSGRTANQLRKTRLYWFRRIRQQYSRILLPRRRTHQPVARHEQPTRIQPSRPLRKHPYLFHRLRQRRNPRNPATNQLTILSACPSKNYPLPSMGKGIIISITAKN